MNFENHENILLNKENRIFTVLFVQDSKLEGLQYSHIAADEANRYDRTVFVDI